MTNGSADVFEPPIKEDESDGLVAKVRKKAPWVIIFLNIISHQCFLKQFIKLSILY